MPVSVKDERIIIYLEINKLEEMIHLCVYAPRQAPLPQSAQNCRELASRSFFLHRKRTGFIWLINPSRLLVNL
jgi:hypothetical protein